MIYRILAILLIPSLFFAASMQRKTVWSGVYTEAQAYEGEAIYKSTCTRCHGASLEGGSAYPLAGDHFIEAWREDNADSLFTFIKTSMPPRSGDPLSDETTIALVSYIFWSNNFPMGNAPLDRASLESIRIEGQGGPRPLPNNAVVQMVGCMTKGEGNVWKLTSAAAPARSRKSEKSTPDELQAAEFRPLGSETFELRNFAMLGAFKPEAHEGHKMLTKGVLMRQPNGDQRISLTGMEMLSSSCR